MVFKFSYHIFDNNNTKNINDIIDKNNVQLYDNIHDAYHTILKIANPNDGLLLLIWKVNNNNFQYIYTKIFSTVNMLDIQWTIKRYSDDIRQRTVPVFRWYEICTHVDDKKDFDIIVESSLPTQIELVVIEIMINRISNILYESIELIKARLHSYKTIEKFIAKTLNDIIKNSRDIDTIKLLSECNMYNLVIHDDSMKKILDDYKSIVNTTIDDMKNDTPARSHKSTPCKCKDYFNEIMEEYYIITTRIDKYFNVFIQIITSLKMNKSLECNLYNYSGILSVIQHSWRNIDYDIHAIKLAKTRKLGITNSQEELKNSMNQIDKTISDNIVYLTKGDLTVINKANAEIKKYYSRTCYDIIYSNIALEKLITYRTTSTQKE